MAAPVWIYLDLSNIFINARAWAAAQNDDPWAVRLHAGRLCDLLAAGRPVASATLVMNSSISDAIRQRFGRFFKLIEVERGVVSGLDQAADELLQNRMFTEIHQPQAPGVVVLATGDGAGWAQRSGFTQPLIAARRLGFGIEVASFSASLHCQLRRLALMPGNALVDLDREYRSFTFEQGGVRFPDPINLRDRDLASPRPWLPGELDWLDPSGTNSDDQSIGSAGGAA